MGVVILGFRWVVVLCGLNEYLNLFEAFDVGLIGWVGVVFRLSMVFYPGVFLTLSSR